MAINLDKPLRWSAPAGDDEAYHEISQMLMKLQGNILKGHGRPEVTLLFFKIDENNAAKARIALREIADHHVTSAWQQLNESRAYKAGGESGRPFVHLSLAQTGYEALKAGDPHQSVVTAPPLFTTFHGNDVFRRGMRDATNASETSDDVSQWEAEFQTRIDGVLLVADRDRAGTDRLATELEVILRRGACTTVVRQQGSGLEDADGNGIEHFGYVDGRSQPLVLVEDLEAEAAGKDGIAFWDPRTPLNAALIEDPGAPQGTNSFGSYLIFRKLEQNVLAFKRREQEVATALGLEGEARELAGAMLVGRFEDGTPVTRSDRARGGKKVANDFNYAADDEGTRCPFHAHIRKTNPRGSGGFESPEDEHKHLFIRRGIPYADKPRSVNPGCVPDADSVEQFDRVVAPLLPTDGVGLLFMAYNSDLANQFKFMQAAWANNPGFPSGGPHGLDPVIGQGPLDSGDQKLPTHWSQGGTISGSAVDFSGFVTMKGGEYFFSPSLTFLKGL